MQNKYAVVVGASRGIGQAVAITLSRKGFRTVLVGRSKEGLEETAAICKQHQESKVINGDITSNMSEIVSGVQSITSSISVLWLGAAGFSEEPASRIASSSIRELIRSGFESLVELVHHLYPLLAEGRGHVIGACSDWSDFLSGGPSVFGSTKVALAGFLDKLRAEAKSDGIQVTALKMGNVANTQGFGLGETERQIQETGTSLVALEDVCAAIEFIISRRTGNISEMTLIPADLDR
jgi:NADP-dependent 3-hydroxy acid dehydrogenase YdfG